MSTAKTDSKGKKPLSEQTVRRIRRAYRPGVRLTKLQEHFGLTGATIISVANRSTDSEYETGRDEYEPPPHIRGTRRREPPATPAWQERQPMPIQRTEFAVQLAWRNETSVHNRPEDRAFLLAGGHAWEGQSSPENAISAPGSMPSRASTATHVARAPRQPPSAATPW